LDASTGYDGPGQTYRPAEVPSLGAPPSKPRFDRARLAGLLPVAAVVVPLSILALGGWLTWRAVWDDAGSEMLRSARSAAEYGARTLESYNVAAGRLNDRLRGLSDAEIRQREGSLHLELQRMGAELSQTDVAYVIDRDGFPLLASNIFPVPRDVTLADRDYFKALSAPDAPAVHVSRTLIGRFDGTLLFSVSRRRRDTGNPPNPSGFDGVVLVSVSPFILADGMRRLLAVPTDRMALVRADGYGLSSTSGVTEGQPLPRVEPSSPFNAFAASGAATALYLSETAIPGAKSLLAMQRVAGFPVYAVSIRARADIVARWRDIMLTHLAFGVPATLGLFLLSLRVWRDQRRLAATNADLRSDKRLSTDRLDRAQRFGLVGTFEFDLRSGVSRRSTEYMSVHGLPAIATEETHQDWVRRLHPDDRQRAESHLMEALSDASGATVYAQSYRIVLPTGEVRWIAARGEITRDAAGRAIMLLGAHVDVTPLRATELALAESDARLRLTHEAIGIGTWEWQRRARSLTCSRRMIQLWGLDPAKGAPGLAEMLSRIHPQDKRVIRRLVMQARRDEAFHGELRVLRPRPSGVAETIWVAVRAKLLTSTQLSDPQLMGVAYDITERKRSEELAAAMGHEVEHRAKNALAVVSSLLHLTKAASAAEFVAIMDGRVRALGQTMALLGQGRWQGTDLREMLRHELRPFDDGASGEGFALDLDGPPVLIDVESAQPLAMALHELVTNAAKYGALSVPGGRLEIRWRIEAERLHLVWREIGGPPLTGPPPQAGFGSKLIKMLFEGQIRGQVVRRWESEGLVCELSLPFRPKT
jgi:PAS domain S-box-containing protein